MSVYFTKEIIPDIVNGDVSKIIQSDKSDLPFGGQDVLFDWTEFQIPSGGAVLESVNVYVMGEDGGANQDVDMFLYFAKTVNGNAPDSLGITNSAMTTAFNLPTAIIGGIKLEGSETNSILKGPAFGTLLGGSPYSAHGMNHRTVFTPEDNIQTGRTGFDTYYVCAFAGGAFDFSTGVLADGAVTSDSATSITVKTVDPRKCFQIGDTVHLHDVNAALGTVKSMTSTNITLNAAIADGTDIADEDEFINANAIRVKLGFSK
tara:strand:- start:334 stop:1116 length:783 start_codon:yes stop_codon:yes gene_type:complete